MSDSDVIVINVPEVAGALSRYPELARPEYQQATTASLLLFVPIMADYPPEPPNSTYRRTGTLGRLWTAAQPEWRPLPSGFEGSIGNATPYAMWVEGDDTQARIHRGRWPTPKIAERRTRQQVIAQYQAAVKRIEAKLNRVTR